MTTIPKPKNTKKVFVVHGHDDALKNSVARALSRLSLEPIILHEQPNRGRTIIERFVAYVVEDRSSDSARALRERIPPNYRCRDTRRDFWLAYDEIFLQRTHRLCGKEEGETCHVERWNNTLRP